MSMIYKVSKQLVKPALSTRGPLRDCQQLLPPRENQKPKGLGHLLPKGAWLVTSELPSTQPPISQCLPCRTLVVPFNHLSRWKRRGFCGQPVRPFLPRTAFTGLALKAGSHPKGWLLQPHPEEPQSFLCPTPLYPAMLALLAAHMGHSPRGGF